MHASTCLRVRVCVSVWNLQYQYICDSQIMVHTRTPVSENLISENVNMHLNV